MVRVDKIYKEKEYRQAQQQTAQMPPPNLGEPPQELRLLLSVFQRSPVRSALALVGVLALLYIGFKAHRQFANMKAKVLKSL